MTERELKQEAADFLDAVALSVASGWGKGRFTRREEPCCLVGHGANLRLYSSTALYEFAMDAVFDHLKTNITNWNDAPERTQDDVIALCHQVAHQLRQEAR